MSDDNCSNLDTFLLGGLPADAESRFTAHLDHCETCRDTVDQQRWIDGLLTSPLARELESPPDQLIDSFHKSVVARRRPTRLVACVFATAAALAIAAGWTVLNRQALDVAAPDGVGINIGVDDVVSAAPEKDTETLHATFVGGPDVLVVPVVSRHPNVTIVRVYPTYKGSYDAQASTGTFEPDHFNGG